jgi:hypothetical protein
VLAYPAGNIHTLAFMDILLTLWFILLSPQTWTYLLFLQLTRKLTEMSKFGVSAPCKKNTTQVSVLLYTIRKRDTCQGACAILGGSEKVGSDSNSSNLYSGDDGFDSLSGHRLFWLKFSRFFSVPPGKFRDSTLSKAIIYSFFILPCHYHAVA